RSMPISLDRDQGAQLVDSLAHASMALRGFVIEHRHVAARKIRSAVVVDPDVLQNGMVGAGRILGEIFQEDREYLLLREDLQNVLVVGAQLAHVTILKLERQPVTRRYADPLLALRLQSPGRLEVGRVLLAEVGQKLVKRGD